MNNRSVTKSNSRDTHREGLRVLPLSSSHQSYACLLAQSSSCSDDGDGLHAKHLPGDGIEDAITKVNDAAGHKRQTLENAMYEVQHALHTHTQPSQGPQVDDWGALELHAGRLKYSRDHTVPQLTAKVDELEQTLNLD